MRKIDYVAQAVLGLSNFGGVSIMIDPEDSDYLYYQWYEEEPERVKILNGWDNETEEYRFYFMIGLTEFYIDEFMRINM